MTSLNLRAAFALSLLLFLLTVPAVAQTDQPTAEPVATEVIELPTDVEIVEIEPATDTGGFITNLYVLIGGAIAVFAAGGLTVGTALLTLATRFRENPAEMAAIESLASSVPGPVAMRMLELAATLTAVGELFEETFDGIPAASKTTVSPDDEDTRQIGRSQ